MTLKQMEYALVTAKCASLSEAAKRLFVSQPSLSESIKKLETELGFEIFSRERTGVSLTEDGEDFLNAAQSIMDQISNIERKHRKTGDKKVKASISSIHYYFMGEVFAKLVNEVDHSEMEGFELNFLDTGTKDVIDNVSKGVSEVGIISYTDHNKIYVTKELKRLGLECHELMSTKLYAFVRGGHPVARPTPITMKELEPYPYASVWQDHTTQYFFTEEGIFLPANPKKVFVKDCGAMNALLQMTDAFAMGSGIIPDNVDKSAVVAVPVEDAPITSICWIRRSGHELSYVSKRFLTLCAEEMGTNLSI